MSGSRRRSLPVILSSDELARQKQVDKLLSLGKAQMFYDRDKVLEFAEKAYEMAFNPGDDGEQYKRGMAGAISLMAGRLVSLDEFKQALEQTQLGLVLFESDEPDVYRTELLSIFAESLFFMGEYAEGLSKETESLKLFQQLGEKTDEARVLSSLSIMHFVMEHQDVALESGDQAIRVCRELSDPTMLMLQLNNMAWMQMEYRQLPLALTNALECLALCEVHDCKVFEAAVLDTIAAIHVEMENLDLAEEAAIRCIEVSKTISDTSPAASAEARLSRIYAAHGQLDQAITHAEKALQFKILLDKRYEMTEFHQLLFELYERNGQFEKSLAHMKELYRLDREKSKQQADDRVTNLRIQHQIETTKKDSEIYRLRAIALEGEIEERRLDQIRLETENSLDPPTGLFNRRHLPVLQDRLREMHAAHMPTSLLMLDIDHFKKVNDTYGHLAGDHVIAMIAQELKSAAHGSDIALRFGGEEFLVFMPNTDVSAAAEIAENIRAAIAASSIVYAKKIIPTTISVGVATSCDVRSEELRSIIERADRALYRAKESGRNRVETDYVKS